MPRKYYKENQDAISHGITIYYECPNRKGIPVCSHNVNSWEIHVSEHRLGDTASVYFECKACGKHHNYRLKD